MGIAKRKAGSVVKCPKCGGEIIVPVPEGSEPVTDAPEPAGDSAEPVHESPNPDASETAATEHAPSPPPEPKPPPARVGVFLSVATLAISIVVIVLLLILVFVFGLIIGRFTVTSQTALHQGFLNGSPLNVAGQRGAINPAFQRSHSACIARTRSGC